ncbi:MAG: protein kinase, partial [Candidatus Obscuribacterales bacterium]|nr:protein kinase [Candidatus Obscuribacterales bacterium]
LTGRGELEDKELGFDAGVDDYMVKPFHLKELSAKLKALLRRVQPAAKKKTTLKVLCCDICGTIFDSGTHCEDCYVELFPDEIEFMGGGQFEDKYDVNGVLGRGGMSVVFKARHRALNKEFAIKLIDSSRSKDIEYLRRFQLEAQALSKMNHPNVVAIHDYGVTDSKQPYIVMDYVEGLPLFRVLNRLEPMDISRCVDIFKQCCMGIGHAHKQGLVHRDLKPANIILSRKDGKEHVLIVDFGVAKRIETEDKPSEQLTKEGKVFGTTTYMSPEHCLGQTLDPRSDIYAFGCIMYEVLAARPPFLGENVLDTLQKQINESPVPLSEARGKGDLPRDLEMIIHRTLEKIPQNRYQSMDELLAALQSVHTAV